LLSNLLRKNRTAVLDEDTADDRRLLFRDREGAASDVVFGSGIASTANVSSPFTSFLQKLALLQEIAVAFANHLLLGKFRHK